MSTRRTVPAVLATAFALLFFGLGNYLGARQTADSDGQLALMRSEIAQLKRRSLEVTGTAGRITPPPVSTDDASRASMVADIKRQLQDEMGLLPLNLLRNRSESFVELYSYDDHGSSSYGTAGYLGEGYFITVKHGVVALNQEGSADPAQDHVRQVDVQRPAVERSHRRFRRCACRSRPGRLGHPEGQREGRDAGR